MIHEKGGQRDNPDLSQFRIPFCQVMVDGIILPSKSANCQEDLDIFLFALTKGKKAVEETPKDPRSPDTSQMAHALEFQPRLKVICQFRLRM